MNKIILITFFLFLSFSLLADYAADFTILSTDGLSIYKKQNIESESLVHLPFGTVVKSWYRKKKPVTINGIEGFWTKATYKDISGYIFSSYIYDEIVVDNKIEENEIRITKEDLSTLDFDYHPSLQWYGLYMSNDEFYLKKINVSLLLSKIHDKNLFIRESCDNDFLLRTDQTKKALFLISSNIELQETNIPSLFYDNSASNYSYDEGFLYPEQEKVFSFNKKAYSIKAFEKADLDTLNRINKTYQLKISYEMNGSNEFIHSFNISSLIHLYGNAEKHCKYHTPRIHWVGDLNSDGLLDFIIHRYSMVRHGGGFSSYSLLFSYIKNDEFGVKLIDSTWSGPTD